MTARLYRNSAGELEWAYNCPACQDLGIREIVRPDTNPARLNVYAVACDKCPLGAKVAQQPITGRGPLPKFREGDVEMPETGTLEEAYEAAGYRLGDDGWSSTKAFKEFEAWK